MWMFVIKHHLRDQRSWTFNVGFGLVSAHLVLNECGGGVFKNNTFTRVSSRIELNDLSYFSLNFIGCFSAGALGDLPVSDLSALLNISAAS